MGYDVTVVRGGTFAENCNRGAEPRMYGSDSRYLFLNDDCVVNPDLLRAMMTPIEHDIIGCQIVGPKNEDRLSGVLLSIDPGQYNVGHVNLSLLVKVPEKVPENTVFLPCGSCISIKSAAFAALGGFDEDYKNGWEDIDLFLRVLEKGYTFGYVPMNCIHHERASQERAVEGCTPLMEENRRVFLDRWPKERLEPLLRG